MRPGRLHLPGRFPTIVVGAILWLFIIFVLDICLVEVHGLDSHSPSDHERTSETTSSMLESPSLTTQDDNSPALNMLLNGEHDAILTHQRKPLQLPANMNNVDYAIVSQAKKRRQQQRQYRQHTQQQQQQQHQQQLHQQYPHGAVYPNNNIPLHLSGVSSSLPGDANNLPPLGAGADGAAAASAASLGTVAGSMPLGSHLPRVDDIGLSMGGLPPLSSSSSSSSSSSTWNQPRPGILRLLFDASISIVCFIFFFGVGWVFFHSKLFQDYEVQHVSVQVLFSTTFTLSCSMFLLIIFEITDVMDKYSRWVCVTTTLVTTSRQ